MSLGISPKDLRELEASDFDGDLARRAVVELMPGVTAYLADPNVRSLPNSNAMLMLDMIAQLGQDLAGMRDKIVQIATGLSVQAFEERYNIAYSDLVNNFLSFSTVIGLTKRPMNETDYTIFKSGRPLANGYDCALVPGVGLQFTTAWGPSDTAVLFIHALGLRAAWRHYVYRGSTFEGVGNRTANLSRLGSDIYGRPISPTPTQTTNLMVYRSSLLTEGATGSYVFSIGTGEPIVTFNFDIRDAEFVHFVVIRES